MTDAFNPTRIEYDAEGDRTDPFVRRMRGQVTHSYQYFDVPFVTDFGSGLYQGGVENGLVLPENIQNLVSLYPWEKYTVTHDLGSMLGVLMHDSKEQGMEQVEAIVEWVIDALKREETVLVHCQAGLNRSSLVVARVLMEMRDLTAQEAIDYIREKRSPACLSNPTFVKYLHEVQKSGY